MDTVTVSEAITALKRYHADRLDSALNALSSLRPRIEIIGLFKHFFPAQAAAAEEIPSSLRERPLELEFVRLLEIYMFPAASDTVECIWDEEMEFPDSIPLYSVNPYIGEISDPDDASLTVGALRAIGFGFQEFWDDVQEAIGWRGTRQRPTPIRWEHQHTDYDALESLCREEDARLAGAAMAIKVICGDEANLWIQADDEYLACCGGPDWSVEAIESLTAEWRAAKPMLDAAQDFVARLEEYPPRTRAHLLCKVARLFPRAVRLDEEP